MRDIIHDATQCVAKFRKSKIDIRGPAISFRVIGCTWQCQTVLDTDRATPRGVQIRIREDRSGGEFPQAPSKVSLGANILNKLSRANNIAMTYIARQATLGRLLIIGERILSLQKTITSQKAAFQTTQKHSPSLDSTEGNNA